MNALFDWQACTGSIYALQELLSFLISWTSLILLLGIAAQILGGLMLLLGVKEKIGAILLIMVLFPATFLFHPFWAMEGSVAGLHAALFFDHLALCGGLILVALHGLQIRTEADSAYMEV